MPLELVTQTVAILAKRGVGKSYTASIMAEEMLEANQQVVVIDPTGAWWGLRSSADGKRDGYPILVVGGDHGDIPLDESSGELLAGAIVERRFSAILDLSLLRKGAATRFMASFAETLYRLNREPVHLIVDEADAVAPQRVMNEEARCLGAMEDIVRRGRKRGIGCTLITQRPAVLNKNVLTQCEMLVALRLVHPKDIDAIEEWVNVHADPEQAKKMIASLPSLPVGTAWFWSPGWGDVFECVRVRKRRTFDSSATPRPGETINPPSRLADVDVQALGVEISKLAERVKADDPRTLKRTIADLERQVREAESRRQADPREIEAAVARAVKARDAEWTAVIAGLKDKLLRLFAAEVNPPVGLPAIAVQQVRRPDRAPSPSVARLSVPAKKAEPAPDGRLGRAERRILAALAQHGPSSKGRVAILAGYAVNGGGFNNALSRLRSLGFIEGSSGGDALCVTAPGLEALGHVDPLPGGRALIDHWLSLLGKAEREILAVLTEVYPSALSKEDVATRTESNYAPSGGGFNNAISRLRTLELVTGRGELKASEELMES